MKKVILIIILSFLPFTIISQDYHWLFDNNQVNTTQEYHTILQNTNPLMFIPGIVNRAIIIKKNYNK